MGVQAGAESQLKALARHRLGGAIHDELPAGEALVEVALLQVKPGGGEVVIRTRSQ